MFGWHVSEGARTKVPAASDDAVEGIRKAVMNCDDGGHLLDV